MLYENILNNNEYNFEVENRIFHGSKLDFSVEENQFGSKYNRETFLN